MTYSDNKGVSVNECEDKMTWIYDSDELILQICVQMIMKLQRLACVINTPKRCSITFVWECVKKIQKY